MTARWIFDRGPWNISKTNKGFNYIFNTSKEDHMIAKVLSGYKPKTTVQLQDLSSFDAQTLDAIAEVQRVLFSSCYKLATERFNVNKKVLDVLTAVVVRHFPLLKGLNPGSPIVTRIEAAVSHAKCSQAYLLAWASHHALDPASCKDNQPSDKHHTSDDKTPKVPSQERKIIDYQAAVIKHFIEHIKRQDARMDVLEAKQNNAPIQASSKRSCPDEEAVSTQKKKKRRGSLTRLHATWFAWFAQEPRWMVQAPKQQRSEAKILVAFMKLFLNDGFVLDQSAADYRDRVLELGLRAENAALTYLRDEHKISSRGSSAVLKHLQGLHNKGALNNIIQRYQRLLQTPAIQDPSPGYTQDVLEEVSK